ncbi:MAG TPA: protoporphyrinogen oxidase [Dissulfurispiraceae bacterium]|nr:protoporphyrinogen oxidase [Dissulfurispiraceae bacterium]
MSRRIAIAGGGISGLSLAYALLEKKSDLDVVVYEADSRPGGKIMTDRTDGYVCEAGVNGFLDNKPATLQLSKSIAIEPIRSNDNARKRCIYFDGALRMIPMEPAKFFLSDFLSLGGRLRMLRELFVPKKIYDDETMEAFAIRRVGREFFDKLLDPMASGVYAGDPAKMSIRSCFGKVYDLEQQHGGLIKGFMAIAREKKKAGGGAVEAGPGGTLMSYHNGMFSLIEALCDRLGARIETDRRVVSCDKQNNRYVLGFGDGTRAEAETVIFASPSYSTAQALKGIAADIAALLQEIPYPALSVIAFAFRREKIARDLNLFGFLVPSKEKRRILGTLFDTSIFPNRAPEGHVLLRTMVGGARAESLAMLEENKLIDLSRSELATIADIKADPEFARVYRWEKAIPQYHVGHYRRVELIDSALKNHPGLYIGGNCMRGVAVNDCIGNAYKMADQVVGDLGK